MHYGPKCPNRFLVIMYFELVRR